MLLPVPKESRPRVRRPSPVSDPAYACPRCDLLLHDGAAYEVCPACSTQVDWVDLRLPVWACPTCDAMVNANVLTPPTCSPCERPLHRLRVYERPALPGEENASLLKLLERALSSPIGVSVVLAIEAIPALSMALHPQWRWEVIGWLLPFVLGPAIFAAVVLVALGQLLPEMRQLRLDLRTRAIHGIEHATVNLLERRGFKLRGGLTENGLFNLWLLSDRPVGGERPPDGGIVAVRHACKVAIRLLRRGSTRLAFDRRCGTTWVTLFILSALATIGAIVVGLVAHIELRDFMLLVGGLLLLLGVGSRPIGWILQRTLTVSTRFERARITRIQRRIEPDDAIRFIVHLRVVLKPSTRERRHRRPMQRRR